MKLNARSATSTISTFRCRSRTKTPPQTTILRRPPSRTSSCSASSRTTMAGSATLRPTIHTALPGTSGFGSSSSLPPASPSRSTGQRIAPWRSSTSFQPTLPQGPAHRSHHLRPGTLRAGGSSRAALLSRR